MLENEIDRKSFEAKLEDLRASLKSNNDLANRLASILDAWADANCILFYHGETLRGVSRDDLLVLVAFVEAETRKH